MSLNGQVQELQKSEQYLSERIAEVFDRLTTVERQNELFKEIIKQLVSEAKHTR